MLDLFDNQMFIYGLVIVGLIIALVKLPDGIGNLAKKALGGLWIITALFATYKLYEQANIKMWATQATIMQWSIILIIFTLVLIGFAIFGYYGLTGAYDNSDQD